MKILICITELNYISRYIKYVLYMYITSDTEKSENSSHDRYRTYEQMHIDGSSSVCSAKCKQM